MDETDEFIRLQFREVGFQNEFSEVEVDTRGKRFPGSGVFGYE
jgi:hypothetical protein